MIEVSVEMQNEAIDFVADRTGTTAANMLPAIGAAVLKDGELKGAAVFNNYHVLHKGSWCEVSVAIDDVECVSRRTLRQIFEYPFEQLCVSRLQAVTAVTNQRCRSFIERLGFKLEGVGRRAHDGEQDAAVYSMLPAECRWLGGLHGKT